MATVSARIIMFLLATSLALGARLKANNVSSELLTSESGLRSSSSYNLSNPQGRVIARAVHAQFDNSNAAKPSDQETGESESSSESKCASGSEEYKFFTGCKQVHANGLTFDCRFGPGTEGKNVMLLHGFPEWSSMYVDAMRALSDAGYQSVACNQRGYSPGASPNNEADYKYNLLRDDLFAVASAVGFDKFHLVAHDHGAVLGWWSAGSQRGRERILSYTAMSVPHNDAFSDGLFGPKADLEQQIASQYFSMFTLPDSASIKGFFWTGVLGYSSGFKWPSQFQKALWWYNGAMEVGVLAGPPVMSRSELWSNKMMYFLRFLFGDTPPKDLPVEGIKQKASAGSISMPVLYVCGSEDSAILCNKPFAMATEDYCGKYEYLEVKCGHDPMNCNDKGQTKKVIEAIVKHVSTSVSEDEDLA